MAHTPGMIRQQYRDLPASSAMSWLMGFVAIFLAFLIIIVTAVIINVRGAANDRLNDRELNTCIVHGNEPSKCRIMVYGQH